MLFIEPSFEKLNAEAFGNPVVRKLSTVNVLALTAFGLSMVILRDVFELDFLLMNTVAVTVGKSLLILKVLGLSVGLGLGLGLGLGAGLGVGVG